MSASGMYFDTPDDLNVGDFALVPALPEGLAEIDPTTTPMELVLVMAKKGEGEELCFTCMDTGFNVKDRCVTNLFINCCEGVGAHPKHVDLRPQRPIQDEEVEAVQSRMINHIAGTNTMMQRIV